MAFPWTEVATIASAAGAGAAWLAASASREAVARTHRAFVFPEWRREYDSEQAREEWGVRLHNDGPGVALDVRWSVYVLEPPEEAGGPPDHDPEELMRQAASEPMRGMAPGDSTGWMTGTSEPGVLTWIVVRFTDSAGMRWEYHEPDEPSTLADPLRRLGKVRGHRSLRWRLRRLRRRPLRESLQLRKRADW